MSAFSDDVYIILDCWIIRIDIEFYFCTQQVGFRQTIQIPISNTAIRSSFQTIIGFLSLIDDIIQAENVMRDVIPTTNSVRTHQISLAGNKFIFLTVIIIFCVKLNILPKEFRIRIITFQVFHVHPVSRFCTMPQIGLIHFTINSPQIVLIESGSTECRYTTSQSTHIIIFFTIFTIFASIVE